MAGSRFHRPHRLRLMRLSAPARWTLMVEQPDPVNRPGIVEVDDRREFSRYWWSVVPQTLQPAITGAEPLYVLGDGDPGVLPTFRTLRCNPEGKNASDVRGASELGMSPLDLGSAGEANQARGIQSNGRQHSSRSLKG